MDAIDKIVFTEQTPDLKGGPRFLISAHTYIQAVFVHICTHMPRSVVALAKVVDITLIAVLSGSIPNL